jgi:DNA repair protein RecN (Recombination protein N)
MLTRLTIHNFALIDDLTIELGPGLNVVTGETGAGKSIIIEALAAALGGRVRPDVVRSGADSATVVSDFVGDDGLHTCAREIRAGGRTTARVDGSAAPVAAARELGGARVVFVAQGEQQDLFRAGHALRALDAWGGEPLAAARAAYEDVYRRVRDMDRELDSLTADERERERRISALAFEVNEIASARLVAGEDGELESQRVRLTNAERLIEHAGLAMATLAAGDDEGALSGVRAAQAEIERLAQVDPQARAVLEAISEAMVRLEEAASALRGYAESIERDPQALEEVIARLDLIAKLKRKYGETIEDIERYRAERESELAGLEGASERRSELRASLARERGRLDELAQALSDLRTRAARRIEKALPKELRSLGFADTRFQVGIDEKEPDASGKDAVTFYVALNPGEPLMPLENVASMGEASRAMLGLRAAFADGQDMRSIVFDEIDIGIGGMTGHAVGAKLKELARERQVICITHLPQIAELADRHIAVSKQVAGGRTTVSASVVADKDRDAELARMRGHVPPRSGGRSSS